MSRRTPQRDSLGTMESARIGPFTVLTTIAGQVSRQVPVDGLYPFRVVISRLSVPSNWILDCSDLVSFEPGAVTGGAKWFEAFKSQGGTRVLMVARNHGAHMIGATVGFGIGLRVETFEALPAALDALGLRPDSPSITRLESAADLRLARAARTLARDVSSRGSRRR